MENLAHSSLMIMGVVTATVALVLMSFESVSFQEDRDLSNSRKYLSLVYVVISANCFLHEIYQFRSTMPSVGIAFDITTYFLAGVLMCMTYIPILEPTYSQSKSKKFLFSAWAITSVCLWVAALFTYGIPSKVLIVIGGGLCIASFLRVLTDFVHYYRQVADVLTDDVDQLNVESFSRFVYKSVIVAGITGLASIVVVMVGIPEWQSYFNLLATLMFFHLGMSFVNYVASLK